MALEGGSQDTGAEGAEGRRRVAGAEGAEGGSQGAGAEAEGEGQRLEDRFSTPQSLEKTTEVAFCPSSSPIAHRPH